MPNPGKTAVYSSTAEDGTVQYVGITDNLEARSAAHLSQKGIEIDAIPGLQNISRSDARAVEQVLIEYNGLGKDGGSLINKINSISTANPIYAIHKPHLPNSGSTVYRGISGEQFHGSRAS